MLLFTHSFPAHTSGKCCLEWSWNQPQTCRVCRSCRSLNGHTCRSLHAGGERKCTSYPFPSYYVGNTYYYVLASPFLHITWESCDVSAVNVIRKWHFRTCGSKMASNSRNNNDFIPQTIDTFRNYIFKNIILYFIIILSRKVYLLAQGVAILCGDNWRDSPVEKKFYHILPKLISCPNALICLDFENDRYSELIILNFSEKN